MGLRLYIGSHNPKYFFELSILFYYFLKILFIHERHRERQRHRQRKEKQAPCRETDVGLDSRTPGSCPGLKAGAQPLSHPGIPDQICSVSVTQHLTKATTNRTRSSRMRPVPTSTMPPHQVLDLATRTGAIIIRVYLRKPGTFCIMVLY